jgi:hypothetical protein
MMTNKERSLPLPRSATHLEPVSRGGHLLHVLLVADLVRRRVLAHLGVQLLDHAAVLQVLLLLAPRTTTPVLISHYRLPPLMMQAG